MNRIKQAELYEDISQIIIDVRTPKEYEDYHIEGALNVPLFTNDQRHKIGTLYKQVSVYEAKKLGLSYIGPNLTTWMDRFHSWTKEFSRVVIYCQRGGMRSASLVSFFSSLGFDGIYQLEGGIKGHRQYVMDQMPLLLEKKSLVVLHGHTGVGKTKLLVELDKAACPIINLEKLAENAGSVFGNLMYLETCPSQKQFEEKLYEVLRKIKGTYIFIESESKRIGHVSLPDWFMSKMEAGIHILVTASHEQRVCNLISDYEISGKENALIACIDKLRKRISNEKADKLINYVHDENYEPLVSDLLTYYYDPLYQYTINQYNYNFKIHFKDLKEATQSLIDLYRKEFI